MNKQCVGDLAIVGGAPAFQHRILIGRPNILNRDRFLQRVDDILDRAWLTNNGDYVRQFEQRVCLITGARHCIAVSSGTMALMLAARAAGLAGEVIVPSFTFVATAHALEWLGIRPVFCDVDRRTHNLDPGQVEKAITSRTTAILAVHLWGRPCAVTALGELAAQYGLRLLFDAAQAFGCSHLGRMIGTFGDAEVFSFHATKYINTLEGGAVVTNDDYLAQRVRLMRNFGFSNGDRVISCGINGKMNEVSAAMGLTGLDNLEEVVAINHHHYERYRQGLAGISGIHLLPYDQTECCNYQYIVIEIDPRVSRITAHQLDDILRAENIFARRYFYLACHHHEPYSSMSENAGRVLPATDYLAGRVLCLPTGTTLGPAEIDVICQVIRLAANHGDELQGLWRPVTEAGSLQADGAPAPAWTQVSVPWDAAGTEPPARP